jgi:thymidylate synthase
MDILNFPTRRLNLAWNQRSVDTFLGLPYNIASYAYLTHILAHLTNHAVGELTGFLGDTHLYVDHLNYVNEQLKRTPKNLPQLKINKNIDNIYDFKYEDFEILNYDPDPNWKNVNIAV